MIVASIATLPNISFIDEDLQSEHIHVLYTYNQKYYIEQIHSPSCLVRFIRSCCVCVCVFFFYFVFAEYNDNNDDGCPTISDGL